MHFGTIQQPSHVLKAMGLSDEQAARSVRISLGRFTTQEDIRLAAAYISRGNFIHSTVDGISNERDHADHTGIRGRRRTA